MQVCVCAQSTFTLINRKFNNIKGIFLECQTHDFYTNFEYARWKKNWNDKIANGNMEETERVLPERWMMGEFTRWLILAIIARFVQGGLWTATDQMPTDVKGDSALDVKCCPYLHGGKSEESLLFSGRWGPVATVLHPRDNTQYYQLS